MSAYRLDEFVPETCMPGTINVSLVLSGRRLMVSMTPDMADRLGSILATCARTFSQPRSTPIKRCLSCQRQLHEVCASTNQPHPLV